MTKKLIPIPKRKPIIRTIQPKEVRKPVAPEEVLITERKATPEVSCKQYVNNQKYFILFLYFILHNNIYNDRGIHFIV